ncbi:hypothetical protein IMG5_193790 [Ichthyophthirius multifiliis]|uniref:Uncharacterized protein n=1 Tax=Ichthyophthirius multifiliis TaxID=5932 RepID=G0R4L9_ICHMU|nr:hypothetical protein IMG5_193790 [Ichthyophthirius multifiliis]EGR27579.1 hypothetical protein IMG5_193790 [Ichthyophthirius multifiliis]|eukprot:XP_004025031.1 hypothetical protein IMG5_193790 [Ichthyophthirius multifiliis]
MLVKESKNNQKLPQFSQYYDQFTNTYKIIFLVAISQGVLSLSELGISFLYKDDFKLSPSQVSILQSLIGLPWILKPLWGVISDTFTIFGDRRKSYIVIFSLLSFFLWITLAFFVKNIYEGIFVLFLIQFSNAFNNVVAEALLVEISQEKSIKNQLNDIQQQAEASKNVSLFFGIKSFGVLISSFLGGYLLQFYDKHYIFAITGLFPLFLCIGTFSTFFTKDKEQVNENNKQKFKSKDQIITFISFIKKPFIYKPIIFIFLFMMTPTSNTTIFFFYTNKLHFQPSFMGQLKFVHAFANILALWGYNKYLKSIQFKKQFIFSTFLCVFLGLSQLLLVTRYNLKIGIPDKIFCLGDSIIIQIIGEINILPILILACRLCPKNIEGTMYAMLMSTINFGSLIAGQLGGLFTYYLRITETNFDNLWILVVIANVTTAMPLLFINMIDTDNLQEIQQQEQEENNGFLEENSDNLEENCEFQKGNNFQQEVQNKEIYNEEQILKEKLNQKDDKNYSYC